MNNSTRFNGGNLPNPDTDPQFYDNILSRRILAYMMDILFMLPLIAFIYISLGFFGLFTFGIGWLLIPIAMPIAIICYHMFTVGSGKSATWGMRIMGIELREQSGARLNRLMAMLHALVFYIMAGSFILLIVNFFVMLIHEQKRGMHDFLFGIVGINSPE